MTETQILAVKAAVRERDGYRCVRCGMTREQHLERYGKTLDVHRLVPCSEYTLEGCIAICRKCHGREPKIRGGHKAEPTAVVRVPALFARRVRVLAAHFEVDVSDYLAAGLRPIIAVEEAKMLSDMAKERPQHG